MNGDDLGRLLSYNYVIQPVEQVVPDRVSMDPQGSIDGFRKVYKLSMKS